MKSVRYTQCMLKNDPPKKTKILLTGFLPFSVGGGNSVNVSQSVVEAVRLHHPNLEIIPVILPALYENAEKTLEEQIAKHRPDLVVSLGESNGENAAGIRMETVAHSKSDLKDMQDKSSKSLKDNLKIFCLHEELNGALAALTLKNFSTSKNTYTLSDDCGKYVCNDVFYHALRLQNSYGKKGHAVFIHLNDLDMSFSHTAQETMARNYTKTLEDFLKYIGDHPQSFTKPLVMSTQNEHLLQFRLQDAASQSIPFKMGRPSPILRSN